MPSIPPLRLFSDPACQESFTLYVGKDEWSLGIPDGGELSGTYDGGDLQTFVNKWATSYGEEHSTRFHSIVAELDRGDVFAASPQYFEDDVRRAKIRKMKYDGVQRYLDVGEELAKAFFGDQYAEVGPLLAGASLTPIQILGRTHIGRHHLPLGHFVLTTEQGRKPLGAFSTVIITAKTGPFDGPSDQIVESLWYSDDDVGNLSSVCDGPGACAGFPACGRNVCEARQISEVFPGQLHQQPVLDARPDPTVFSGLQKLTSPIVHFNAHNGSDEIRLKTGCSLKAVEMSELYRGRLLGSLVLLNACRGFDGGVPSREALQKSFAGQLHANSGAFTVVSPSVSVTDSGATIYARRLYERIAKNEYSMPLSRILAEAANDMWELDGDPTGCSYHLHGRHKHALFAMKGEDVPLPPGVEKR